MSKKDEIVFNHETTNLFDAIKGSSKEGVGVALNALLSGTKKKSEIAEWILNHINDPNVLVMVSTLMSDALDKYTEDLGAEASH